MISSAGKGGFGGGGGGTGREVTYRINVLADPKAKKTMDDMAKSAADLEKRLKVAGEAGKKGSDAWTKGLGEQAKQVDAINRKMDTWAKGQKAWQAGIGNITRDNNARLKEQERQVERTARATATAQTRLLRANRDMERSFDKIISGATRLGGAIAHSGLIGERDMQKLLNTLLAVEAVTGAVQGGMAVYRGVQGMGRASAAQAAARSSLGGGFAEAAGANAAGNLAAGAAGRYGPAAARSFGGLGGGGALVGGVAALVGLEAYAYLESADRSQERANVNRQARITAGTERGGGMGADDENQFRLWQQKQRTKSQLMASEQFQRRQSLSAFQGSYMTDRMSAAGERGGLGKTGIDALKGSIAEQRYSLGSGSGAVGTDPTSLRAAELSILKQELSVQQQIKATAVSAAQASLSAAREGLALTKSRERSTMDRIGERPELMPVLKMVRDMASRGQRMPTELMQEFGGMLADVPGFQEDISRANRKRAKEAGAGDLFKDRALFVPNVIDMLGLQGGGFEGKTVKQVGQAAVKAQFDANIKVEFEQGSFVDVLTTKVTDAMKDVAKNLEDFVLEQLKQSVIQQEFQQAAREEQIRQANQ